MNEHEPETDELTDDHDEAIPVYDKRRFNGKGERIADDEGPAQARKSATEIELENNLRTELERREAAEAKLVGVQAKFDQAKADLEKETADMRARLMKTLEDRGKQAQFNFLATLLPVLDNLNLAVAASEKDSSFEHLLQGVKGTARSFEQALTSVGVKQIDSIGMDFDPELHEAVDTIPVDPEHDGKVVEVYSHGYKYVDRLLRPARVRVGKSAAQSAGE